MSERVLQMFKKQLERDTQKFTKLIDEKLRGNQYINEMIKRDTQEWIYYINGIVNTIRLPMDVIPRPSTQDPRPSTQDPRPSTQDPRPSTQDAGSKAKALHAGSKAVHAGSRTVLSTRRTTHG